MEAPLLQPIFQCSHALHYCATHGPRVEDVRGEEIRIEKEARHKKFQQRLEDFPRVVLPPISPISSISGLRFVWWSAMGWTFGLNQCNDLTDDLLLVQGPPGASQFTTIALPFALALPIKKEQWTPCQEVCNFLKEDPYRPGPPLEIKTKNKAGMATQKIRSSIC